ncbi:MAG: hypothetical protein AUK54_08955 [Helicobacteraceae bacterium CG2_30_36_10]|nr:MAG: hypothetical protein AUK54_08955 [Helicobacteraceae bacterium CG2_30_36_10]
MNSIKHIQSALSELDKEVEAILLDWSIPLNEKDNLMLPILQQKRVLTQTLEDLTYLKENPPKPNQACGISKYREE